MKPNLVWIYVKLYTHIILCKHLITQCKTI